MAKTKKKHKKQKQQPVEQVQIIAYDADLIDEAAKEAALAAKLEILAYAERFKSDNTKRPIKELADDVERRVLAMYSAVIQDASPLE